MYESIKIQAENISVTGPTRERGLRNILVTGYSAEKIGGEGRKVGELSAAVIFELEAYPEPKALTEADLKVLMREYRSTVKVAKHIGASQAFVWSKLKN